MSTKLCRTIYNLRRNHQATASTSMTISKASWGQSLYHLSYNLMKRARKSIRSKAAIPAD